MANLDSITTQGNILQVADDLKRRVAALEQVSVTGNSTDVVTGGSTADCPVYRTQIANPTFPLVGVATEGGSLSVGRSYNYQIAYVDAQGGTTAAGPVSSTVTLSGTKKSISLSGFRNRPAGAEKIFVYRNAPGLSINDLCFLTSFNTDITTYIDVIPDSSVDVTKPAPISNTSTLLPEFPKYAAIEAESLISNNTTYAVGYNTSQIGSCVAVAATPAVTDEVYGSFFIGEGTYTLNARCVKNSLSGIVDVYIDGVLALSNLNFANATNLYNSVQTGAVTISGNGYHTIIIKTKGTSTTNYFVYLSKIWLVPVMY